VASLSYRWSWQASFNSVTTIRTENLSSDFVLVMSIPARFLGYRAGQREVSGQVYETCKTAWPCLDSALEKLVGHLRGCFLPPMHDWPGLRKPVISTFMSSISSTEGFHSLDIWSSILVLVFEITTFAALIIGILGEVDQNNPNQ